MTSTTCRECGNPFTPARADARFCSSACRQRAYRNRKQPNTSRNTTRVTDATQPNATRNAMHVTSDEVEKLRAENARLRTEVGKMRTVVEAMRFRNGVFTKGEFTAIMSCLHTDPHGDQCNLPAEKLNEAFDLLTKAKDALVKPPRKPSTFPSRDEMNRNRAAYDAKNRERAGKAAQTRAAKKAAKEKG